MRRAFRFWRFQRTALHSGQLKEQPSCDKPARLVRAFFVPSMHVAAVLAQRLAGEIVSEMLCLLAATFAARCRSCPTLALNDSLQESPDRVRAKRKRRDSRALRHGTLGSARQPSRLHS